MRKILTYAFSMSLMPVAFTTLLLTGCADYDAVYEEIMRREQEPIIELRLNIGVGIDHLSRTPQGGEKGDERELGQHQENNVNSILIYYYNDSESVTKGINADESTRVTKLAYIEDVAAVVEKDGNINDDPNCTHTSIPYHYKSIKLSSLQTGNYQYEPGDHYVVIANAGDFDVATLGLLRDKEIKATWNGTGSNFVNYKNFVMSNEHESFFTLGMGTEANPHKITVTIERMAARIDFAFDSNKMVTEPTTIHIGSEDIPVLKYPAKDKPKVGLENTYGYVNLTHVRPFNVKQAGQDSYLIKRSALPDKSGTEYLAPEKAYTNQAVAAFPIIVEPTTWDKSILKLDPKWYGSTRSSCVNAAYAAEDAYKIRHYKLGSDGFNGGVSTDGGDRYYVLDYANENTMEAGKSLKEYATGYILRAVYEPKTVKEGVWEDDDSDDSTPEVMTGIQDASYTVGTTFYRYRPLVTTFDESQAVYFTLEADANEYGNQQLKATGIPYVIEKYTNGVCYYHVYARHDNSGGSPDATPMEFGIVRNNIYRLKVSFTGPGYPEPEVTNTEPLGIKPYLYTRPWYKVEHEEIEI